MGREFPLEPVAVPLVRTANRCISTKIPVPASLPVLDGMRSAECRSMSGQPPIIWHEAKGACIKDPYGNRWLDFSSGVLVASCGYGHPAIVQAMLAQIGTGVYHSYGFPTCVRADLAAKLVSLAPHPLTRVFLVTTGAEATECCIKLAFSHGRTTGKRVFISYENGFHGRTMGAQLAGGSPALKAWLSLMPAPEAFVQVPFPDGFRNTDLSFAGFEACLRERGVEPAEVCGVMAETFQGVNARLWPVEYARAMREWCDRHGALLIFDEVQAAFGRAGKWFGFEHLGIVPDLVACGKGLGGGMPVSAVLGREDVMNIYGPGEMTSTHSANPVCSAAALATLCTLESERLVENAAEQEPILRAGLERIQLASKGHVGAVSGLGLVGAVECVTPRTTTPDPEFAFAICKGAVEAGVMLFAPVGVGGGAIKICPPLVINSEQLREGLQVICDVVSSLVG